MPCATSSRDRPDCRRYAPLDEDRTRRSEAAPTGGGEEAQREEPEAESLESTPRTPPGKRGGVAIVDPAILDAVRDPQMVEQLERRLATSLRQSTGSPLSTGSGAGPWSPLLSEPGSALGSAAWSARRSAAPSDSTHTYRAAQAESLLGRWDGVDSGPKHAGLAGAAHHGPRGAAAKSAAPAALPAAARGAQASLDSRLAGSAAPTAGKVGGGDDEEFFSFAGSEMHFLK